MRVFAIAIERSETLFRLVQHTGLLSFSRDVGELRRAGLGPGDCTLNSDCECVLWTRSLAKGERETRTLCISHHPLAYPTREDESRVSTYTMRV